MSNQHDPVLIYTSPVHLVRVTGLVLPSCWTVLSNGAVGPCSSDGVVTVITTEEFGRSAPKCCRLVDAENRARPTQKF